jgi:hypothetical protein
MRRRHLRLARRSVSEDAMSLTRLGILALGSVLLAPVASVALARQGGKSDEEPAYRVVERDGTQRIGRLVFRGTGFVVEPTPETRGDFAGDEDAPTPSPGEDGRDGEDGAPGEDGGPGQDGGDGQPGGRGGDGGGGRGGGRFSFGLGLDFLTALDGNLLQIDRVEQDGKALFVANRMPCSAPQLSKEGYASDYGGLGFALPPVGDWEFVTADPTSALAVRRDASGDIVGRIRLHLVDTGNGADAKRALDQDKAKPHRLFRKLDRARFAKVEHRAETDEWLVTGQQVRRVIRQGREALTGVPLHLEVDIPLEAPFFPAVEILARGDACAEIIEQGRWVVETLRYQRDQPVPPPKVEFQGDRQGQGRAGGLAGLIGLGRTVGEPPLVKGRYDDPWLGVAVKAECPKGWEFRAADALGLEIAWSPPQGDRVGFQFGYGAVAVLDGAPAGDGATWICERYLAGLPPNAEVKSPPKVKRGKVGSYATREFFSERPIGRSGSEAQVAVAAIEHNRRHVIVLRVALGSSTQAADRLAELARWMKTLALSPPKSR